MLNNKNCFKCMHANLPCPNTYTCLNNRHKLIIQQNVIGVVIALEYSKDRPVLKHNYPQQILKIFKKPDYDTKPNRNKQIYQTNWRSDTMFTNQLT